MTLGRRRFAGLALPLLAAAWLLARPGLLPVATRPGPTFPGGPKIVMLKDIGLASYLDRREIVRSSEGYKLDVMSNDWWGESLGGMLGRVLVIELSQRLPGSTIYARKRRHHGGSQRHRRHQSPASRCPTGAGTLILLAQVAVEFNRPRRSASRTFTITKPLPTPDTAGLVVAISDALGELADGIAALLQA